MNIVEHIRNVVDYINCSLFSKAGQYEVYFVKKEFGDLNGRKYMNARLYAVEFDKDEPIIDKELPMPIGRYGNHMEMDFTKPVYYDAEHGLVYILEHRLYGGKDGRESLSLIDRRHQCEKIKKRMLMFLFTLAKHNSNDEVKLNVVENMRHTLKYSDILHGKTV